MTDVAVNTYEEVETRIVHKPKNEGPGTARNTVNTYEEVEARIVRLADRPITFEMFLDLNIDGESELIDGAMVKKMSAQWEHESLLAWLMWLIYGYVQKKNLGSVAISRYTVKIDENQARLPDLLFVRRERENLIESRALSGAPDLVVEIRSPNDRPSDMISLETDYRRVGVSEIVFIDPRKRRVRLLHKRDDAYEETELSAGTLTLETVPGFALEIAWLFDTPRPDAFDLLMTLLAP